MEAVDIASQQAVEAHRRRRCRHHPTDGELSLRSTSALRPASSASSGSEAQFVTFVLV